MKTKLSITLIVGGCVLVGILASGCSLQTRDGTQLDVTDLLGKTREEVIQVLGEPSRIVEGDMAELIWAEDRLPPGFAPLHLDFRDEPVCQFVRGQITISRDLEEVLDVLGIAQFKEECRHMERGNALVVSCVAPPYEAELVEARHPGISTNFKLFLVWRQDSPVTQSLAKEFEAGRRGFQDYN